MTRFAPVALGASLKGLLGRVRMEGFSKEGSFLLLCFVLLDLFAANAFLVTPALTALPIDFMYRADLISHDDFFDPVLGAYKGVEQSVSTFDYRTLGAIGDVELVENSFEVKTLEGDPIIHLDRTYGIDRYTRAHVAGYGDHDRAGYLFAPRGVDKQPFDYWHVNYDEAAHMEYAGEEVIGGLVVYRYEAILHPDQTKNLSNLPGVGVTRGINLDVRLTLWIEPVSGWLVKYADDSVGYYYDLSTGQRLYPWNHFSNSFTEASVGLQVENARAEKFKVEMTTKFIPLLLVLLGVLLVVGELMMVRASASATVTANPILPLVIFMLGALATLATWWTLKVSIEDQITAEFNGRADRIAQVVTDTVDQYVHVLQGTRSFFAASENVKAEEWTAYVRGLHIEKNFNGITSLSYEKRVPKAEVAHFPYVIYPKRDVEEYFPVTYVYSIASTTAFGFDVSSDELRNKALRAAVLQDEPVGTGIVQNAVTKERSFLIYAPVFKNSVSTETVADRQRALEGYVGALFTVDTFFANLAKDPLFGPDIDVEIFDAPDLAHASADTELYDSSTHAGKTDVVRSGVRSKTLLLPVAGRTWTVSVKSLPGYGEEQFGDKFLLIAILVGGLLASFFFSTTIYAIRRSERRANTLAKEMTKDLEQSRSDLQEYIDHMSTFNVKLDAHGTILLFNEPVAAVTEMTDKEVFSTNFLTAPWWPDAGAKEKVLTYFNQAVETGKAVVFGERVKVAGDKLLSLDISFSPVMDSRGVFKYLVAEGRDISNLKVAESALSKRGEDLERLNRLMVDREIKMAELKKQIRAAQDHE